jgi:hypothetical protein
MSLPRLCARPSSRMGLCWSHAQRLCTIISTESESRLLTAIAQCDVEAVITVSVKRFLSSMGASLSGLQRSRQAISDLPYTATVIVDHVDPVARQARAPLIEVQCSGRANQWCHRRKIGSRQ